MDVIQKIWKFKDALDHGYYSEHHRAVIAITFPEALDLWKEMKTDEERRYMALVNSRSMFGLPDLVEIPKPEPLPAPVPGEIWGEVYGIRVYVEGLF